MSENASQHYYLHKVTLAPASIRLRSPLISIEQDQALRDLQSDTYFRPKGSHEGPYDLEVSMHEQKMHICITDANGRKLPNLSISLKPYKSLIRDYFLIVESYEKARNEGNSSRLEAIDMGRRGLHNEGAESLKTRLAGEISMNTQTARRLFTLMCIMSAGRQALWF